MALIYPAVDGHNVDVAYSALVEPNLFANSVFQNGVSFTDKYQLTGTGTILVHKPGIGTITSTAPGADFSDAIVADSLITLNLDHQFNRSRKIYGATLATVKYPMAAVEMETAIKEVSKAWQLAAGKALVKEPNINIASNILTVINPDGSDVYDTIVSAREELVKKNATPDTILVSPAVYSALLKAPEFQRSVLTADSTVYDGYVGRVAGLNVFEAPLIDSFLASGDSADKIGTTGSQITWAANDELEFIMYDHDAFSIVTAVDVARLVEEPTRFVGILAQIQIVSGFKLTNPDRAIIKIHDESASAAT